MDFVEAESTEKINQKWHIIQALSRNVHTVSTDAQLQYLRRKWTHDLEGNALIDSNTTTQAMCHEISLNPEVYETYLASVKVKNAHLKSEISRKLIELENLQ